MNFNLAKSLYEKNLINQGVTIKAKYTAIDIGGRHSFENIDDFLMIYGSIHGNQLVIHCCHKKSGVRRNLTHENIIEIDGMTPERLAETLDLNEEGEKKIIGNKRGRKTNAQRAAALLENNV